ncbi:MAG: T9SS C-terminal target domain-containing protein, partial [Cytophagales bacterium]
NTPNEIPITKDEKEPTNGRTEENYGASFQQFGLLGINRMHDDGFRGEGMHIAVIDGGFTNANINPLFRQARIVDTYNFTRNTVDVYNNITSTHGTRVLSLLAAFQDGQLVGSAYKASFYLFTTENDNANIENKIEEVNWIFAAERSDSLGVDIITTSLGYRTFDDSSLNYTINDLDGKTALISQAAAVAVRTGMIVVACAGNEALASWRKIIFPADVDSVLTVGSVDANKDYAPSSSRGKTADGRIKPDVVAMGQNAVVGFPSGNISVSSGTSFAAPQIAGLAAGLWQANPTMSNMQIVNMIRKSGTRFSNPSDSIGYGIPNYVKIKILSDQTQNFGNNITVYPNPLASNQLQIWFDEQYIGKNITLTLSDVLGKTYFVEYIKTQELNYQLDTSNYNLTSGLYFLRISSQGLTKMVKVIK